MKEVQLTEQVDLGGGAIATIVNPTSFEQGGVEWRLRYWSAEEVRYMAASIIEGYDYLISSDIGVTEAIRRLRILRSRRHELIREGF